MIGERRGRARVRLLEERDLEEARQLHNEPSVLSALTDARPVSEPEQQAWFQNVSTAPDRRRFTVLDAESSAFAGVFRVDRLDLANGSAMVGLDLLPDYRGTGLAEDAYAVVLGWLFHAMRLRRVAMEVLETNERALGLYRKLGFTEEGRMRGALWRDGEARDLLILGMLREEFAGGR